MKTEVKYLIAVGIISLACNPLEAEDQTEPIFNTSAFIAVMNAEGRFGPSDAPLEGSWSYPAEPGESFVVHDIADTPVEFEEEGFGPGANTNTSHFGCLAEVDDTTVRISMMCQSDNETGSDPLPYMTSTHVSGEYHLHITEPAEVNFEFCGFTDGVSTQSKLSLKKLTNGNWDTEALAEQHLLSAAGSSCTSGTLELEPGTYQFYFMNYAHVASQTGFPSTKSALALTVGELEITPLVVQNPADINGDGKVDGIDLGRILGAWGSTAGGGDVNGDGVTDGQDLAIILGSWTG